MTRSTWVLADPAVRDWLSRICQLSEADGSELVTGLGTPHQGRPGRVGLSDNCRVADTVLDWLVDEGWIKPLSYSPSDSQRFFGVGGRGPGHTPRNPVWRGSHTYPQEWRFRSNPDSSGLRTFLEETC